MLGFEVTVFIKMCYWKTVIEFFQSKSATVLAEVRYLDSQKNIIDKFPLDSEFWFRNIYLEFWGDIRALTKGEIKLSKKSFIPFPSDEILIYNNSENIKRKLKSIIKSLIIFSSSVLL